MSEDDPRFPKWEPNENTVKSTILHHMDYAHEDQAEAQGIVWGGLNHNYWKRKYTRDELLDIHRKYHQHEVKP